MIGTSESVPRLAVRAAAAGLLLALTLIATGCQRRTNIVMIPADSAGVAIPDSAEIAVRDAQQLWDTGTPDVAAAATARLLAREFRDREPGAWRERASYLLDSLGVGAEFAEAPCALIVNFFSRSDPEGGAWPYLYWCGPNGVALQAVEGKNLHLQALVARGLVGTGVGSDSVRRIAAVFIRRAAAGPQPLVITWAPAAKAPEHWIVAQTLGSDSLGGYGTASFEAVTESGAELAVRTYRTPSGFVECVTCPHVYSTSRFQWTADGFARTELESVPSPYAAFTAFVQALVSSDRPGAETRVSDPALVVSAESLHWNEKRGSWRPAPGADESPVNLTIFRGQSEAYTVHFRSQGRDWLITGFEPVARSVE